MISLSLKVVVLAGYAHLGVVLLRVMTPAALKLIFEISVQVHMYLVMKPLPVTKAWERLPALSCTTTFQPSFGKFVST